MAKSLSSCPGIFFKSLCAFANLSEYIIRFCVLVCLVLMRANMIIKEPVRDKTNKMDQSIDFGVLGILRYNGP